MLTRLTRAFSYMPTRNAFFAAKPQMRRIASVMQPHGVHEQFIKLQKVKELYQKDERSLNGAILPDKSFFEKFFSLPEKERKAITHVYQIWGYELNKIDTLYKKGEYTQVMQECESIIKEGYEKKEVMVPVVSKVYLYLARVLREGTQQERNDAEKYLQKAISLDPKNKEAKDELNSLRLEQGKAKDVAFIYEYDDSSRYKRS